jgi:hypothetical protein
MLGCERLGEVEKVTNLLRCEEAFDRITAEIGQWWIVKVGFDQRALCEKDLLNGSKKPYLLGVVVMGLNVSLEAALHNLMVIGDGIDCEQVAEESEKLSRVSHRRSGCFGWRVDVVAAVRGGACAPGPQVGRL